MSLAQSASSSHGIVCLVGWRRTECHCLCTKHSLDDWAIAHPTSEHLTGVDYAEVRAAFLTDLRNASYDMTRSGGSRRASSSGSRFGITRSWPTTRR